MTNELIRHPGATTDLEVAARLADYEQDAKGAFSPNTIRALKSDSAIFAGWCVENGHTALPAEPATVRAFIEEMAKTRKPATVRRYVASISAMHRAAGLVSPASSEKVRLALKTLGREQGTRQHQAGPITENNVASIMATTGTRPADLRDLALVLVGRDLLARRSELVALEVGDLTAEESGGATVLIRRGKTDQDGKGQVLWVSPRTWRAVRNWLEVAGVTDGKVFRELSRSGRPLGPLAAGSVNAILRKLMKRAKQDAPGISGHSLRVGMAQDLVAAGAELPELMRAGRWRTPTMPARYVEHLTAKRGAVAKFYEKQQIH